MGDQTPEGPFFFFYCFSCLPGNEKQEGLDDKGNNLKWPLGSSWERSFFLTGGMWLRGRALAKALGSVPSTFKEFSKALCFCMTEESTVGLAVGGQRSRSFPCLYSALSKKSSEQN